jgi:hypothetical protein
MLIAWRLSTKSQLIFMRFFLGLMGTVTDVYGPDPDDYSSSNRPFKYDLDDGTGVIKVCVRP